MKKEKVLFNLIKLITSKTFCFILTFIFPLYSFYQKTSNGFLLKTEEDFAMFLILIVFYPIFFEIVWKYILKNKLDDLINFATEEFNKQKNHN